MSLLVICPTRNRPELCQQMLHSFIETRRGDTQIVFSIDDDEPQYAEYTNLFSATGATYLETSCMSVTEHINHTWAAFPHYDFYMIANDDVIFKTPAWDVELTSKFGINYGNDLLQGENLPTFPVVPKEIAQALGYLQQPTLERFYGDTILKEIGQKAGCLNYFKDVIIEHRHFINGHRESGAYEIQENVDKDKMKFANWYANNSISDIRKVQLCLKSR